MGNTLSTSLIGKGLDLRSMTIDSPAGRLIQKGDNKGKISRCTVYFDKWTESGEGRARSFKPVKDAALFTKHEDDAEALEGCIQHDCKHVKVDGESVYFHYDSMTKPEQAEFNTYKGKDTIDVVANTLIDVVKKATCQAIMSLDIDERKHFAEFIGSTVVACTNKLQSKSIKNKKQRITLW